MGMAAAFLGFLTKQPMVILSGSIGAALAMLLLKRTIAGGAEIEEVFGNSRTGDISQDSHEGTPRKKWTWRLKDSTEPIWERDVPFRRTPEDGREVLCDIWRPSQGSTASGLAFIYFHGGAWRLFDKDTMTRTMFRHLAAQGHVIMDVAYRLYPETNMSGMVDDARHSVTWMTRNAADYGVDPNRIVVAGGSSGGQLALLVAYANGYPASASADLDRKDMVVRAVVAYYPPVDLHAYEAFRNSGPVQSSGIELKRKREILSGVTGGSPEETPELYDKLSPISYLGSHCPPTLLFLAGDDDVVPNQPVRMMKERLEAEGVPVALVAFPHAVHAFDMVAPRFSPYAQSALHYLERFLAMVE
jgi:acetyl esterase/lipase